MTTSARDGQDQARSAESRPAVRYREAEMALWNHYRIRPDERMLDLRSLQTRVRVQEVGKGAPALFIHGGPNAGSTFAALAAALKRRCLLLDRPGCGLSGPVDYDRLPIPQLAPEVLRTTLDELGIERVDLVGSSFGGAWAIWFALAHPERVQRMVLLGAPAFVPNMAVPRFMQMMLLPVIGGLITRMRPSVAGAKWIYRQMGHSKQAVDLVIPRIYWDWSVRLQADTATMINDSGAIRRAITRRGTRPDLVFTADQLRSICVPTLLYWGDADTFGGADLARPTAGLIPNCAVDIAAGAGHLPWLDDPVRAAAAITAFLDQAAGPDRAEQETPASRSAS